MTPFEAWWAKYSQGIADGLRGACEASARDAWSVATDPKTRVAAMEEEVRRLEAAALDARVALETARGRQGGRIKRGGRRQALIDAVSLSGQLGVTPQEIAARLNVNLPSARCYLSRATAAGYVRRIGPGHYATNAVPTPQLKE